MPRALNKVLTVGFLAVFVGSGLTLPFLLTQRDTKIDTDKPFKSQLGVRGAFSNSGSRDVGPDRSDSPAPGKGSR